MDLSFFSVFSSEYKQEEKYDRFIPNISPSRIVYQVKVTGTEIEIIFNICGDKTMKKTMSIPFAFLLLASIMLYSGSFSPAVAKESTIFEFDTMAGLPPAFTGMQNPIRGIIGGGLPWMISSAHGELSTSGKLEIEVQGLVLAAGPNVGNNPIANFRAIVSCLKSDGSIEKISTGLFPATVGAAVDGGGNAKIETTEALSPALLRFYIRCVGLGIAG